MKMYHPPLVQWNHKMIFQRDNNIIHFLSLMTEGDPNSNFTDGIPTFMWNLKTSQPLLN